MCNACNTGRLHVFNVHNLSMFDLPPIINELSFTYGHYFRIGLSEIYEANPNIKMTQCCFKYCYKYVFSLTYDNMITVSLKVLVSSHQPIQQPIL